MTNTRTIADLERYEIAQICSFIDEESALVTRLREIGFAEGDEVQPLHFGLIGRNPITVRLNGTLVALRKKEAKCIAVTEAST